MILTFLKEIRESEDNDNLKIFSETSADTKR